MATVSRTTVKGPNAFRTISEAAQEVGTPQHVLRFWETRFDFVVPVKRAGGRRFYRPQDVVLLKAIRRLLHDEGLTIKGVQRLHKEQGLAQLTSYGEPESDFTMEAANPVKSSASLSKPSNDLNALLADLEAARSRLNAVLAS